MKKYCLRVLLLISLNIQLSFTKPVGLTNFGNLCYSNSIVQSLYNVDVIKKFALSPNTVKNYPQDSIAYAYIQLVQAMHKKQQPKKAHSWRGWFSHAFTRQDHTLDTALQNFSKKAYEEMRNADQQDASEFLGKIITDLTTNDLRYPEHDQPIFKNLAIQGSSIIACPNEEPRVNIGTPTTRLDIPIMQQSDEGEKKLTSLEQCLDFFYAPEEVDLGKPPKKCTKSKAITALSDVIIITLKRVILNQQLMPEKLSHDVTIPLELTLKKYFASPSIQDGHYKYDLASAVEHGGVAEGGHYVAHVKDANTGVWYNCNDATVTQESIQIAQERLNKSYLFIYTKKTHKLDQGNTKIPPAVGHEYPKCRILLDQ